jgi:hypothetical protein
MFSDGVSKVNTWGSVKSNRTNKSDSGDPRQLGRSLNSDQSTPEEGHRLVKALLAIKDAQVRRALIEFAEALAREDRQSSPLPPAASAGLTARHFDQQAIQRAAVILKIAAHHSRDELDAALAAARRAFLYSFEEAGADIDAGRGVFEALDAAVAISKYRA